MPDGIKVFIVTVAIHPLKWIEEQEEQSRYNVQSGFKIIIQH